MSIIDLIKGRKNIDHQESEGVNLAIQLINELHDRKFTFKGTHNRYSGINGERLLKLLQEEIDSMLILYRYITEVKKYTDRKGIPQLEMRLIGKSSAMNRYNPLDIELEIKTEV